MTKNESHQKFSFLDNIVENIEGGYLSFKEGYRKIINELIRTALFEKKNQYEKIEKYDTVLLRPEIIREIRETDDVEKLRKLALSGYRESLKNDIDWINRIYDSFKKIDPTFVPPLPVPSLDENLDSFEAYSRYFDAYANQSIKDVLQGRKVGKISSDGIFWLDR